MVTDDSNSNEIFCQFCRCLLYFCQIRTLIGYFNKNVPLILTSFYLVRITRSIPKINYMRLNMRILQYCNLKLQFCYPIVPNPIVTHQSHLKDLKIEYQLTSSKGQSKTIREYVISLQSRITLATDIKICFHFLTLELECCQIIDAFWLTARPSVDVTKKRNKNYFVRHETSFICVNFLSLRLRWSV